MRRLQSTESLRPLSVHALASNFEYANHGNTTQELEPLPALLGRTASCIENIKNSNMNRRSSECTKETRSCAGPSNEDLIRFLDERMCAGLEAIHRLVKTLEERLVKLIEEECKQPMLAVNQLFEITAHLGAHLFATASRQEDVYEQLLEIRKHHTQEGDSDSRRTIDARITEAEALMETLRTGPHNQALLHTMPNSEFAHSLPSKHEIPNSPQHAHAAKPMDGSDDNMKPMTPCNATAKNISHGRISLVSLGRTRPEQRLLEVIQ